MLAHGEDDVFELPDEDAQVRGLHAKDGNYERQLLHRRLVDDTGRQHMANGFYRF